MISPIAKEGFLDLSNWNFERDGKLKLDGEWEFYWEHLYNSEEIHSIQEKPVFFPFPSVWNEFKYKDKTLSAKGYATFRLKLKLPANCPPLALRTREQSTAYAVFWNNRKLLSAGKVGTSPENSIPDYKNTQAFLSNPEEDVEIIYWISNYEHRNGGAWYSLILGTHEQIISETNFFRDMDFFLTGIIFIMILYHLFLYFYRRSDISNILFSVFCFVILLRSLSIGERVFNSYIQVPFGLLIRVEYFTWYATLPLGYHFLYSQFNRPYLKRLTIICYCISILLSIGLFLPPYFFTNSVPLYQPFYFGFILLGFSFMIYYVYQNLPGAKLILFGFVFMILTTVNDLLYANQWINSFFLSHYGLACLIFSQSLGISIRFSKAFRSIENLTTDLKEVNKAYSRFVPIEFLNFLDKQNITEIRLGEQVQRDMSILFSDIRSFTELSEKMSPSDNFNFLNSYLSRMGPIVRSHNGFIDKYIGDAIMALFPGNVEDALNAAIEMQEKIRIYNQHRMNYNYDSIRVGIGVHTGPMILGTIGEEERLETTVISDAVNLASRIEGLTKVYGAYILISEYTFKNLKNPEKYKYRILDRVKVKGKSNTIAVYEIFNGMPDYLLDLHLKTKDDFEKGLDYFWNKDFQKAIECFSRVISIFPADQASVHFLSLSQDQ
ncbi:MAG TPA: adenylate/guanylate cyclase domain-containing protein [Leptospiraceae bacterium]|nr:adenylate/guanylate cyclase domain-containing protein [Leptospiraceae bacterium]HNB98594.1 adenylate/guanylate cyclase domain-containing protein [Leptospiraceae bacterium]HNE10110.1 adenylate/guanylate cyclase domain-containing protein [Leptospiraceae bacterium]HNG99377.1 adenylate/guanylate cyclase domain-containing protein [Leptospiraceae bacterium]HNH54348.1 adenylate/guanylate cyclase domain-containing protein [Leptospiraceae bacterium]